MTLLAMRTAIVTRLQELFPALAPHIKTHHRTVLTSKDIDRCLDNTSLALRVNCTGGSASEDSKMYHAELCIPPVWTIWIIAKDETGKRNAEGTRGRMRDEIVLGILPEVLRAVCSDGFEMEETSEIGATTPTRRPDGVRWGPVYEGEPDDSVPSALVWAVRFTEVMFIPPADPTDLLGLATLVTNYDITPLDEENDFEASDTVELDQSEVELPDP